MHWVPWFTLELDTNSLIVVRRAKEAITHPFRHHAEQEIERTIKTMPDFYKPDLGTNSDDPFARDGDGKLVRRSYWLDMSDRSIVMVMTNGIGAHLPNEQKRLHLRDIGRGHLIDDVCIQEVLPPEE